MSQQRPSHPSPRQPGSDRPGRTRTLAPDLARGFMLLFIALANAHFFLTSSDPLHTGADRAVSFVQDLLVSGRAVPLFSLLFGYGSAWILRRAGSDWAAARPVLRRRGFWMLLIGLVHGVLLLPVDIVGAYGLGLLLFAGCLRARPAVLLWAAAGSAAATATLLLLLTVSGVAAGDGSAEAASASAPSLVQADFSAASSERFAEWLLYTPVTLLLVVLPPLLVGMWAGRLRILERPQEYRRLLQRTAAAGLAAAVAAGIPAASVEAGFAASPGPIAEDLLWAVHDLAGWAGGAGWCALLTLLAWRLEQRAGAAGRTAPHGPVVAAVAAVGERSLSCYLFQSIAFTAVFAPYGLGLGATASASAAALTAAATWAATVAMAAALQRSGLPGPAEAALRKLTYRTSPGPRR